jgi:hypothetical protein
LQQPAELWTNRCETHSSNSTCSNSTCSNSTHSATTPRIQFSNSMYFTLYFTMRSDAPLTRHGIPTLRTSTCRTAPSHQTASVYF